MHLHLTEICGRPTWIKTAYEAHATSRSICWWRTVSHSLSRHSWEEMMYINFATHRNHSLLAPRPVSQHGLTESSPNCCGNKQLEADVRCLSEEVYIRAIFNISERPAITEFNVVCKTLAFLVRFSIMDLPRGFRPPVIFFFYNPSLHFVSWRSSSRTSNIRVPVSIMSTAPKIAA